MSTTTPDGGDAPASQPQEQSAAVTDGHNEDQVIVIDDNGTPSMQPATSQAQDASEEAVSEEAPSEQQTTETQAPDDDVQAWAEKKGLPLNDPVKLAKMYRDAEKAMHEAKARSKELETASVDTAPIEYTGNPEYDSLAANVNTLLVQNKVRDFFADNPEARQFESKMAEIVQEKPYLQHDLNDLYALARNAPDREAELKAAGGKEALTNLAQKQQNIPPAAGATNSSSYQSQTITPQNVYSLIDNNDQEWFEKNHKAISKAMSGK